MPQTVKLTAFLVANQLDIKGIKTFLDIKPLADTSSELFYRFSEAKFQYYFNFGVIVLAGYSAVSAFRSGLLGGVGIVIDIVLGIPLIWFAIWYQRHRRVDSPRAGALGSS